MSLSCGHPHCGTVITYLRGPHWSQDLGWVAPRLTPWVVPTLLCRMAGGEETLPTSGGVKDVWIEMRRVRLERSQMGHLKQVDGTRCKLPLEWRNANIESFSLSQHDSYWARRWEMRKSTDRVRKRDRSQILCTVGQKRPIPSPITMNFRVSCRTIR